MNKPLFRIALLSALALVAVGCQKEPQTAPAEQAAAATSPDGALMASVKLLKAGDFDGLMKNSLPPAEFAKIKADWNKDQDPITDEERQKFADTIGKLTAPDAEEKIYAEIEPQLTAFDAQYQQQIPMYVAMGSGWLQGMVQQNKDMSEESKQQALAAINALGAWVTKTRFTDPAKVKQVIAIVVKAARDLNLKSIDEARALSYEQGMEKGKTAFAAFKAALNVYGFSFDQTLDSIKPEVVSNDGKTAKIKIAYTLLGTPLTGEADMVNVDGRWYGKDTIEKIKDKAAAKAADEAATPEVAPAAESAEKPEAQG
ncbi:hypothetical protein [Dokdonella sp.]|uniref:hypothetical protein n=1 Tax=Dokdonella sp. TaxID=2291710 RepID=UPI0025C4A4DB|nr:hypothetical protein [Dokdonella sp.]MBX3687819.1 hypothetical protein [Dokdonella sp.]